MKKLLTGAIGLVAMTMAGVVPARADAPGSAEKLRRLDIMLMVTGLRCRSGADNFQPDFQAFEARHMADLNAANRQLKADYVRRLGPAGADRALDRLSVVMANEYGNGHPWLGCHELKSLAQDLAGATGAEPLEKAADMVLSGDGQQLAYLPQ